MTLLNFGTIQNDTGLGQDGTSMDAAFWAVIKAAIEAVTHSTTNPTVDAKHIIDEVEAIKNSKAVGSWTSLKDALDGVIDFTTGTLITPASVVSMTQLKQALQGVNLMINDTFLIWHAGDALAPAGWTLAGAGAAVQRCGTGLADTNRKVGKFSARVAYGSATATFYRELIDAAAFGTIDHLKTQKCAFFGWVKADTASQVRLYVTDGASTTYSSYHTGGGAFEALTVEHTISGAGTYLRSGMEVKSGTNAYLSGVDFRLSDHAPTRWSPAPKVYGCLFVPFSGTPSTGDNKFNYVFARPAIIKDVQAWAVTAPGGADVLKIDIDKYETGPAWASIFSAAKNILSTTETTNSVQPDGDYDHRCFTGASGTTITNAGLRLNLDTVGGNVANIRLMIRCLQYTNPLEDFLAYNDI